MADENVEQQRRSTCSRRGFFAGSGALLGLGLLPRQSFAAQSSANTPHWRPEVRFTPRRNWMNDPNGLIRHRGEYHLFFQHNPSGIEHANMSWGHAVSTDLVNWQHLPVALEPDELGEIFSGSAVVDEHDSSGLFGGGSGIVACYTSAGRTQTQSIAHSSDGGRTWTKYPGNPVIDNPGIADFRDPKVIRHEPAGKWVLLLAAGDRVLFYESTDLLNWTKASEFGAEHGAHGGVWECPDLFELPVDGDESRSRWVLVVSINPGGPAGGSATQYFVGDFDGTEFVNENDPDEVRWVDRGADFYACQSWFGVPPEDGRRLWVGWMSNWAYAQHVPTSPWRGAMTAPREVGLTESSSGTRLVQRPVRELESARGPARHWRGMVPEHATAPRFRGTALDIVAEFEIVDGRPEFGFEVLAGDEHRTLIGYDAESRRLFVDRTRSGSAEVAPEFPARHETPLSVDGSRVRLRILLDHCGVEVFAEDGAAVLTELVLPDEGDDRGRVFCSGGRVFLESLRVHELRP
ncbi:MULTISPECIES: glycoside hydrolase family 32 protein [unclassified Actinopolyspora]|uniref:glycoside hydrolase family 32 protein n=1 Tax=unclassified Actinopolyspora TaxID=2639451 RepID=UPI0013F69E63|nr:MULTISPECIES: glycoside hydrolase family 32 protein [unclassified Actinopolyspora]NHD17711.1 glycoside hydrolase family 32 protein [Actinopolyspora sp. BKK2]NHE76556.1 glycoside hydrolase family 32 protein [Actinopolyspora sp. BKK1]